MADQLKLKILWFENFLGLSVDQITLNQQYALTAYYFWPRTEAWEQLKSELDSKPWLEQKEKVKILNFTTDVIDCWGEKRNLKSLEEVKKKFFEAQFIDIQN